MYDFLELGEIIKIENFSHCIEEANTWNTYVHKYGSEVKISQDTCCWMSYLNEGDTIGSISFTRSTYKNKILKEMADEVTDKLQNFFPPHIKLQPERIHLVKTNGTIVPHKDEGGRLACINIGLHNSDSAVLSLSNAPLKKNFYIDKKDFILKNGNGYLLNTNKFHSVTGNLNISRYLITYGFGVPFAELLKVMQL
jgi:hypothetical protein